MSPDSSIKRSSRTGRLAAGRSGGFFERVPDSELLYHFRYIKPEGTAPKQSQSPSSDVSQSESSDSPIRDEGPSKWFNVSTFSPMKSYAVRGGADGGRQKMLSDEDGDADDELSMADSQPSPGSVASHAADLKPKHRYTISSPLMETRKRHNGQHHRSKSRDWPGLTDATPKGGHNGRMQRSSHHEGAGARVEVEKDPQSEAGRRRPRRSRFVEHLNENNGDTAARTEPRSVEEKLDGSRRLVGVESLKASQRFFRLGRRGAWRK